MLSRRGFALFALAFTVAPAAAQTIHFAEIVKGVAVGGHDPVGYFKEGKPVKGSPVITAEHDGITWRFASAENRAAFLANPKAYAPQYGGHCAWAAAEGYLAKGDPNHWRIVDGKLYLNYDATIQGRWNRDVPGFIRKGDANWPRIGTKS
jgi:YHS domain-containing protein